MYIKPVFVTNVLGTPCRKSDAKLWCVENLWLCDVSLSVMELASAGTWHIAACGFCPCRFLFLHGLPSFRVQTSLNSWIRGRGYWSYTTLNSISADGVKYCIPNELGWKDPSASTYSLPREEGIWLNICLEACIYIYWIMIVKILSFLLFSLGSPLAILQWIRLGRKQVKIQLESATLKTGEVLCIKK